MRVCINTNIQISAKCHWRFFSIKFLGLFYSMGNGYEFVNKYYIIELIEWPGKCLLPPFPSPSPSQDKPPFLLQFNIPQSQLSDYRLPTPTHHPHPTLPVLYSCSYLPQLHFIIICTCLQKIPHGLLHPVLCIVGIAIWTSNLKMLKSEYIYWCLVFTLGVCLKTFKI